MGMRLMRIMDAVMGVVQSVRVGTMDVVMRIVEAVIVDVVRIRQERIGEPVRFQVSLITIPDGWAAAGGDAIAGRTSLWRTPEFPRRWGRVQGWRRRRRRRLSDFYTRHSAVARNSTTLPRWRLALAQNIAFRVLLTRLHYAANAI